MYVYIYIYIYIYMYIYKLQYTVVHVMSGKPWNQAKVYVHRQSEGWVGIVQNT